jgi:hypothetical protein
MISAKKASRIVSIVGAVATSGERAYRTFSLHEIKTENKNLTGAEKGNEEALVRTTMIRKYLHPQTAGLPE